MVAADVGFSLPTAPFDHARRFMRRMLAWCCLQNLDSVTYGLETVSQFSNTMPKMGRFDGRHFQSK